MLERLIPHCPQCGRYRDKNLKWNFYPEGTYGENSFTYEWCEDCKKAVSNLTNGEGKVKTLSEYVNEVPTTCPFSSTVCRCTGCAIWDDTQDQCSFLVIAQAIDKLQLRKG